jgi:hypothetical protein
VVMERFCTRLEFFQEHRNEKSTAPQIHRFSLPATTVGKSLLVSRRKFDQFKNYGLVGLGLYGQASPHASKF